MRGGALPRLFCRGVAFSFVIVSIGFLGVAQAVAQIVPAETMPVHDGPAAPGAEPHDSTKVTLGAGAGVSADYEGSNNYRPVPLWSVRIQNLYAPHTFVQVRGLDLSSNLLPSKNFRLGLSGQYSPKRTQVADGSVDDLGRTEDGVLLGVMAGYGFGIGDETAVGLQINARYDVTDEVGGLVSGKAEVRRHLGTERKWKLVGSIETTYATHDYMENYFGIGAIQAARSDLSVFDADAGFKDVGVSTGFSYRFDHHWSLSTLFSYKRLIGDAADSPVTKNAGNEDQFSAGALIHFTF